MCIYIYISYIIVNYIYVLVICVCIHIYIYIYIYIITRTSCASSAPASPAGTSLRAADATAGLYSLLLGGVNFCDFWCADFRCVIFLPRLASRSQAHFRTRELGAQGQLQATRPCAAKPPWRGSWLSAAAPHGRPACEELYKQSIYIYIYIYIYIHIHPTENPESEDLWNAPALGTARTLTERSCSSRAAQFSDRWPPDCAKRSAGRLGEAKQVVRVGRPESSLVRPISKVEIGQFGFDPSIFSPLQTEGSPRVWPGEYWSRRFLLRGLAVAGGPGTQLGQRAGRPASRLRAARFRADVSLAKIL